MLCYDGLRKINDLEAIFFLYVGFFQLKNSNKLRFSKTSVSKISLSNMF